MSSSPGQYTYPEIVTQGDAWAATLAAFEQRAPALVSTMRSDASETVFMGCGSPHYLSHSAAHLWRAWTGQAARSIPASEAWLFPQATLPSSSRLVAVSRSGETTEVLRAIDTYEQRGGRDWLTISCFADRPLARRAPLALIARADDEQSVAQTRSFTSMLVLIQALAALTAGCDLADLATLPDLAQQLIQTYEPLARSIADDHSLQRFIFLGSGVNYGLACEAMLKMKEMSLSSSEAFHTLEFRHGPKSVVDSDTLIVGLVSDTARDEEAAVLGEMREIGARVLTVADNPRGLPADHAVALNSGLDEITRAPLTLPILQLLAYYRSMAKGLDPDRPTHLDAVVKLA